MRRGSTAALAAVWLSITGCSEGANLAEPLGTAREAAGNAPVIDYPIDFAPPEPVPTPIQQVILASRGDDFLAVWMSEVPPALAMKAVRFDRDGVPATKSPITLASTGQLFDARNLTAACAPAGDCIAVSSVLDPTIALEVSTLRADGTKKAHKLAEILVAQSPASVAYDPDATGFLVVWSAPELLAQHVADGVPVEPAPLLVAPTGALIVGLACAPANGCLVLIASDASATSAVLVNGSSVSSPVPLDASVGGLTYGDGVYFTVAPLANGYGVVRLGLDGSVLDAAPIPIAGLGQTFQTVVGAGFDGAAFTVVVQGHDQTDGMTTNFATVAARVRADGTIPAPASIDLTSYTPGPGVACGGGACELVLATDARGISALSTIAIRDDAAKPSAQDLVEQKTSQQLGAAVAIGDQIFVTWSEGAILRTQWLTAGGVAAAPPKDVDQNVFVHFADANDGAGLLFLEDADGARETRVLANGEVGEAVPFEPPASASAEPARFAVADNTRLDGSAYLLRFDAAGRALDPNGVLLAYPSPGPGFTPVTVARSGDTFVAATFSFGAIGPLVQISRIRDTGERIDITNLEVEELAGAMFAGLGCSATECVMTLDRGRRQGGPKPEVWLARFATHDAEVDLAVSPLDAGTGGAVVYDGTHFLVAYRRASELRVARLDDDGPKFGSSQVDADVLDVAASTGDGTALLFSQFASSVGQPPRDVDLIDVRVVLGEGFPSNASTGAGEPRPGTPTAVARGCACELGEERGRSWPAALVVALALAAGFATRRARR